MGEVKSVSGMTRPSSPSGRCPTGKMGKVDVDDAFVAVMEFANGGIGTLEASRFAAGHKNHGVLRDQRREGEHPLQPGRLNELEVFWVGEEPKETQGFHEINVTEGYHPFISNWWPQGHIIGWEHTFVHEFHHFLDCIVNKKDVAPLRRDLRGRLPQQRDLRRHPRVGCHEAAGRSEVLANVAPSPAPRERGWETENRSN